MEISQRLTGEAPPGDSLPSDLAAAALQPTDDPVTTVFVCFGNDRTNLDVALQLRDLLNSTRRWRAPVFVRLFEDSGLDDILARTEHELDLHRVVDDFGQNHTTCTRREIFDPPRDRAAQQAHSLYQLREALEELAHLLIPTSAPRFGSAGQGGLSGESPVATTGSFTPAAKPTDFSATPATELEAIRNSLKTIAEWKWTLDSADPSGLIRQWLLRREKGPVPLAEAVRRVIDQLSPNENTSLTRRPADLDWTKLHFEFVASNRDHVDHLPEKLRSLGYRPCRRPGSGDGEGERLRGPWPVHHSQDECALIFDNERLGTGPDFPIRIERAAELEHERWLVEKLTTGWRYGPERDGQRMLHPSLRPYPMLSKSARELHKDRNLAVSVHSILAAGASSRDWHPECSIGVLVSGELTQTALDASAGDWIQAATDPLMRAIVHMETTALENEFARIYEKTAASDNDRRRRATGSEFCQNVALCAISGLDDPWSMSFIERMHYWSEHRTDLDTDSLGVDGFAHPFRVIIPHVEGDRPHRSTTNRRHLEDLLREVHSPSEMASDCWAIDLLPEALPLAAVRPEPRFEWPPNCPDGRAAEWSPSEDKDTENTEINQHLGGLRRALKERFLQPRVSAYITERADWLVLLATGREVDDNGPLHASGLQTIRRWRTRATQVPSWATSRPGSRALRHLGRPQVQDCPPDWKTCGDTARGGQFSRSDFPAPISRIDIDSKYRLVEVVIDAKAHSGARGHTEDNSTDG